MHIDIYDTHTNVCVNIDIYLSLSLSHITAREKLTQGDKLDLKEVPRKRGTSWV